LATGGESGGAQAGEAQKIAAGSVVRHERIRGV
jgi:hypothetical protein